MPGSGTALTLSSTRSKSGAPLNAKLRLLPAASAAAWISSSAHDTENGASESARFLVPSELPLRKASTLLSMPLAVSLSRKSRRS